MNRTALTYLGDKWAKIRIGERRASRLENYVGLMRPLIADRIGKVFSTMGQYPPSNHPALRKAQDSAQKRPQRYC